ncbi:MAG: MarR family transcriptional regulator, partial [Alphaproteobacteria bacterium]|nr:MarR family transcriptional regulator [Alphaproteobacteria bacterium]
MAPSDRIHAPTPRGGAHDGRPKRSPSEAGRAFGFLVHDVSRLIKRRFERRARQMGLLITRQQAAVVLNIAGNEGVSQAEVAAWLDIEPIALVRMLDKLREEGLVERRAHPTDRRV